MQCAANIVPSIARFLGILIESLLLEDGIGCEAHTMRNTRISDSNLELDGRLDGLGTALIAMHGAEHSIKGELLDQVVSIVRRRKASEECVREIASLMRGWQARNG